MNLKDIIVVLFSLAVVVLLILLTYKGTGWLNKRVHLNSGRVTTMIEKISLGGDKALVIAKVAGSYILIGVTANSITKIQDLDTADVERILESKKTESLYSDFGTRFIEALHKQKKGGGNNENRSDS